MHSYRAENGYNAQSSSVKIKYVKPNVRRELKLVTARAYVGLAVAICSLLAMFVIGTVFSSFDDSSYSFLIFILIPIGFIVFGTSMSKIAALKSICRLVEQIEAFDEVLITQLFVQNGGNFADDLLLVKKLIATGNLPDYEVVGDALIAKKSLGRSQAYADAKRRGCSSGGSPFAPSFQTPDPSPVFEEEKVPFLANCPGCGAPVCSDDDKFCQYCGRRLR